MTKHFEMTFNMKVNLKPKCLLKTVLNKNHNISKPMVYSVQGLLSCVQHLLKSVHSVQGMAGHGLGELAGLANNLPVILIGQGQQILAPDHFHPDLVGIVVNTFKDWLKHTRDVCLSIDLITNEISIEVMLAINAYTASNPPVLTTGQASGSDDLSDVTVGTTPSR